MATITEEPEQLDSGMGSSDARSPEVKSLLPADDDEEDDEVRREYLASAVVIGSLEPVTQSSRLVPRPALAIPFEYKSLKARDK